MKSLVRVPDGFDLETAACVDPLSIALYTVKRSRMQPGDDLLVMGTGPQGLMAILVAKALGAGRIIAVGSGARLDLARSLGAIPIDYRAGRVVEEVRELTDGLGVPAVLECAGTATALRDCCLAAAKGGVVSVIGIPHEEPQPADEAHRPRRDRDRRRPRQPQHRRGRAVAARQRPRRPHAADDPPLPAGLLRARASTSSSAAKTAR